jgi:hypothetical protein
MAVLWIGIIGGRGQRICVTEGIFAKQLGLLRILLDLFGQKVKVLIETDIVAAA